MDCAIQVVADWVQVKVTKTVTFANAHMLALASIDSEFRSVLNTMDINFPDGAPVAWLAQLRASPQRVDRISGPEFMPQFIFGTTHLGFKHYFYGAAPGVAAAAAKRLCEQNAFVTIAGYHSPPYRPLSEEEALERCQEINASGADVIWVSLGCPKQEQWIFDHKHLLEGKVILAVGQALDILAGAVPRAPSLVRRVGFEWLFRLVHNPARLWRRYLVYNSIFVYRTLTFQLLKFFSRDTVST
jgi:N-acetylglucosaminyldiphosphoundecaprenol N-acetyl-beta-D-mannosaminyltransferase